MSKKASKHTKKEVELNQSSATNISEQNEDPEKNKEMVQREPRTINIRLESYHNIIGFFPIADIQTDCSYCETIIGTSTTIPITDDEFLPIDESFSFEVDINSTTEIDQLISSPAILTVYQEKGTFNSDLYEQLQINNEIVTTGTKSFESIVSIYEAFTDSKVDRQLIDPRSGTKGGKKAKKTKPEKPSKKIDEKSSRTSSKTSGKGKKSSSLKDIRSGSAVDPVVKTIEEPLVYGICAIDFLPLFQGEKSFSETMLIKPTKIYKDEKMNSYKAHPKIIIKVWIDDDLDLTNDILMNFTVESIYNIPELMKPDMDYKLCYIIPSDETLKLPILFTNPKHTTESCEALNRCWPGMQRIGIDANTTKYRVSTDNENIFCKFGEDIIPYLAETNPKLEFNMIKRNLLSRGAQVEFTSNVKTYRKLVIEFFMTGKSGKMSSLNVLHDGSFKDKISGKFASDKSSEKWSAKKIKNHPYLHLMTVVDISSLLYPGVTRVRVASPLTTFSLEEALKNGGLEDSYFFPSEKKELKDIASKEVLSKKDKSKVKESKSSKSSKSSKKGGGSKEANGSKDMKKLLPPKPVLLPEPEPSEQVFNENGKPCFVIVEIELSKPLIPKREIQDVQEEIHQLLEKNLHPSSKIVLSSCLTKEYYKEVLNEIIKDMNDKFRRFLDENPNYTVRSYKTPSDFVGFLQRIGSYQPYLTSITKAATFLITNIFKCDDAIEKKNTQSHQNFIGKVFIQLVSEMNSIVNKLVSHGMEPLPKEVVSNDMFFYAKEALELMKTSMAERYFLRKLCDDEGNADYWFDYAVYFLEANDEDKAYECLQEVLLKNANHSYSLLLFAILLDRKGQKEEAESCFLNLMVQESKWLEAWGILYIFYRKYEKYEGMDVAMEMAKKLLDTSRSTNYFDEFEDLAWTPTICPQTVFFRTAILLVKMRIYDWAEMTLSEEIKKHYGLVSYLLAVICYYRKLYSHALEHIDEAKEHYGSDYAVAAISGHCLLALNKKEEAKKEYYHVLESFDRPDNTHLVYINLALILEHLGEDQEARKLILLACKYHPTPYTWLKAGLLYFHENDFLSAEECFNEGNLIDYRHPEIWGNLCLVNLKLNRPYEAELCYQQVINNNLEDDNLLENIREEFEKLKRPITSS